MDMERKGNKLEPGVYTSFNPLELFVLVYTTRLESDKGSAVSNKEVAEKLGTFFGGKNFENDTDLAMVARSMAEAGDAINIEEENMYDMVFGIIRAHNETRLDLKRKNNRLVSRKLVKKVRSDIKKVIEV